PKTERTQSRNRTLRNWCLLGPLGIRLRSGRRGLPLKSFLIHLDALRRHDRLDYPAVVIDPEIGFDRPRRRGEGPKKMIERRLLVGELYRFLALRYYGQRRLRLTQDVRVKLLWLGRVQFDAHILGQAEAP